jgi:hypothetical protein
MLFKIIKMDKSNKTCIDCGIILTSDNAYSGKINGKIYLSSRCKEDEKIKCKNYGQTKKGLITRIYANQKYLSKKRGHSSPPYSKDELYNWMISQKVFHTLFDAWTNSNYIKNLTPTCDRNNSTKPYSFLNLSIVTWEINRKNEDKENTEGIIGGSFPIIGTNKITGESKRFISLSEASRKLSISIGSISLCCSGKQISTRGYFWRKA